MYEEDKGNKYYIGNMIDGTGIRAWLAIHRRLTQAGVTLITLLIFVEIYGSLFAAKNFFSAEPATMNPFRLFADLMQHPFAALVLVLLSYLIGAGVTVLITGRRISRYETNIRGERIDNLGLHGRAKIADEEEISKVFSLTNEYDTKGTIIGEQMGSGKIICKDWEATDHVHGLRNNHILLAAPSSSGKTTNFILQNIISHMQSAHSLIVFDPKGEIYSALAAVARYLGYKVRILNMRADEMSRSDGCDILKGLREADDPETMADDFSDGILKNSGKEFWNEANKNLLSLVLLFVTQAKNFKPITIPERRDRDGNLLKASPSERVFREVAAYMENTKALKENVSLAIEKDPQGDGRLLYGRYTTWSQNDEAMQIASGLSTKLSIFRNKRVADILSQEDITIDLLAEEKAIFFIVPPILSDAFKPVTALFFMTAMQELIRIATKKPNNRLDRMVYLFLEEMPAIGEIPKLVEALNIIRGFNVGMALCTQELSQIEEIYGLQATLTMFANCLVQLCMGANADMEGGGTITNARFFSTMSGMQTISEDFESEHRSKLLPEALQEITELDKTRTSRSSGGKVYLPDDIYRIKGDEILVKPAMHNMFMAKRYFWKRHPLSDICVRNKYTHELFELKTCDHIPHFKSGSDDLFDTSKYELFDRKQGRSRPKMTQPSGVKYDKYLA